MNVIVVSPNEYKSNVRKMRITTNTEIRIIRKIRTIRINRNTYKNTYLYVKPGPHVCSGPGGTPNP